MTQPTFIDCPEKLATFCNEIASANWLAIDTEFQREKTYRPILALIQVATDKVCAVIDPLAIDINPLIEHLHNKSVLKIFHAARQDQEIFYHLTGQPLTPVFDTQLAAPLLGFPEQAGYAKLVNDILGVALDKAHSRTDWTARPLSDDQIKYAADDVIYLAQLYPVLNDALEKNKRINWLKKAFAELSDSGLYENPPKDAWKRIRSARRLKGASLKAIQLMAERREEIAQQNNIPRGWLLKDDIMVEVAKVKPRDLKTLARVRGITDKFIAKYGQVALDLIALAIESPSEKKEQPHFKKTTPKDEAVADLLMAQVRLIAEQQGLTPSVICSRKDLLAFIQGDERSILLSGWREQMVGQELLKTLQGQTTFTINNRKPLITQK